MQQFSTKTQPKKLNSMATFQMDILDKARQGMFYHQQISNDLINGYIKQQQRKYKLRDSNFITCIVIKYHQGAEQFTSNQEKKHLYQNNKKSIKVSNDGPENIRLLLKNRWNTNNAIIIKWRFLTITKDFGTVCRIGCNIIGNTTGQTYGQLLSHNYIITDLIGDQIQLTIAIKMDQIRLKMDIKSYNDDLTIPWRSQWNDHSWSDLEYHLKGLKLNKNDHYCFVIPIIELEHDGLKDGIVGGSEIHLISYCVTFESCLL